MGYALGIYTDIRKHLSAMTTSILARVTQSDIVHDPFPYLHMPDALEEAYYRELAAAFPSITRIADNKPILDNQAYLLSARDVVDDPDLPQVWRDFFAYHSSPAFFREMLAFWEPSIQREYPNLTERFGKPLTELATAVRARSKEKSSSNLSADMMLDCQFGVNSPVSSPGSVRGPHIDKPCKLYAALLYFRHPDDNFAGGDLDLYRPRKARYLTNARLDLDERHVERFATVAYRPNTLVMWLNTPRSLHGVSPRPVTDLPRRYVNFLAESYTLKPDGFFGVNQTGFTRVLAALKRAVGYRDV
jgi:hypothetical protein